MAPSSPTAKSLAEAIGTCWIVLCGCGSLVLAAGFPDLGIGFLGVALAFGLAAVSATYALGHISGAHFNPAITVGLAIARRFPGREMIPYISAQIIGGIVGALVVYLIASGSPTFDPALSTFGANGFEELSPGGFTMSSVFFAELTFTFMFVLMVLSVMSDNTIKAFTPLAIGFAYLLGALVLLPVSNASLNPARSLGPAIFAGGLAMAQLWVFWVAPLLGGVAAAYAHRFLVGEVVNVWRRAGPPRRVVNHAAPMHQT